MEPDDRAHDLERLEILEMKVSYQDRTIEALNEVVTHQQDQIDKLLADVEKVSEVMKVVGETSVDGGEEPLPPHY